MKMPFPKKRLHKKHYTLEEDEKAQDLLVYQLVKKYFNIIAISSTSISYQRVFVFLPKILSFLELC